MKQLNIFQYILACVFAGRDKRTLENTASTAEINYACIEGSVALVPVIVAAVSGFTAGNVLSHSITVAILAAFSFSVIILMMERAILAYGRKIGFWIIISRVAFTLIMAFSISLLVEISIFDDAITEQANSEIIAKVDEIKNKYNGRITTLKKELLSKDSLVQVRYKEYADEISGNAVDGATGKRGIGPIATVKKSVYDTEVKSYNTLEKSIKKQVIEYEEQRNTEISQIKQSQAQGLLGKLKSLFAITDPIVGYAVWVIRLLLIFLDTMVLMIKLTPNGKRKIYYEIMDLEEQRIAEVAMANYQEICEEKILERKNASLKKILELELDKCKLLTDAKLKGMDVFLKSILQSAEKAALHKEYIQSLNIPASTKRKLTKKVENEIAEIVTLFESIVQSYNEKIELRFES